VGIAVIERDPKSTVALGVSVISARASEAAEIMDLQSGKISFNLPVPEIIIRFSFNTAISEFTSNMVSVTMSVQCINKIKSKLINELNVTIDSFDHRL
jgi:hypothetical protein